MKIFYCIKAMWYLPLIIILFIKQKILHDKESDKFSYDIASFHSSILKLMVVRPYYATLCCYRLKIYRWPFTLFYSYPIYFRNNMELASGLKLEHPHGTHLNALSIGHNLHVAHNVTIGNDFKGSIPTIGNNVTLGCGSCVLGGVKINDNVKVGANCVVVKDVPANSTVVGNPAYIVKLNGEKVRIKL